jgi:hypothetical protein
MSNALVRTGQKMDEALATLRREQVTAYPSPASSFDRAAHPAACAAPVMLVERCACAIYDLEWLMHFERQASGLYRAVDSTRIHGGHGSGPGAAQSRVLSVDKIEGRYKPCPWCGGDKAAQLYHCHCGVPVCGGRVKGNLFICRDSCGEQWEMGPPAREIRVTDARQDARDFRRPERGPATWQAPARSSSVERLLLPPVRGRK